MTDPLAEVLRQHTHLEGEYDCCAAAVREYLAQEEPDDTDLSEENIDQMMASGTPVEICELPHQTIEEEEACEQQRITSPPDTVHACPPDGEAFTPCCGCTPFELPHTDRMTTDPTAVTCSRPAYDRLKAAAKEAGEAAHLHAMRGMKAVFQLCRQYGTLSIPPAVVLEALGLDENANPVLNCPHCGEDLTGYDEDDLVFRKGDHRPYCSGECVITMHRRLAADEPRQPLRCSSAVMGQPHTGHDWDPQPGISAHCPGFTRCAHNDIVYGQCILHVQDGHADCFHERQPLRPAEDDDQRTLCDNPYPGDENFNGQLCELPMWHFTDHRCDVQFPGTPFTAQLGWKNQERP